MSCACCGGFSGLSSVRSRRIVDELGFSSSMQHVLTLKETLPTSIDLLVIKTLKRVYSFKRLEKCFCIIFSIYMIMRLSFFQITFLT